MIVNAHEHLESKEAVPFLLEVNKKLGIEKTVLVGSPIYTLTLNPEDGFEKFHENNEELLGCSREWDGNFDIYVTLDPVAGEDNRALLESYLKEGATGLKCWWGHEGRHGKGPFHVCSVDDLRMSPVWEFCQEKKVPVIFHVALLAYELELWRLLSKFPKLRMIVPHLMVSKNNPERLQHISDLLSSFPYLFTDISFGRPDFLSSALAVISRNVVFFRSFFKRWGKRILFGTDMVVTREKTRYGSFMEDLVVTYKDLLEKEAFSSRFTSNETLNGLGLPKDVLEQIYWRNYNSLLGET